MKPFASNPCFEVWFVAHFHELRGTYSGSSQVLEDLKHQIPDYDKGRDCYRKLKDHTQEAIERCKAKERQYKDFATGPLRIATLVPMWLDLWSCCRKVS